MNNAYHPDRVEQCFRSTLIKWLQVDPSPTWDVLDYALDSMYIVIYVVKSTRSSW